MTIDIFDERYTIPPFFTPEEWEARQPKKAAARGQDPVLADIMNELSAEQRQELGKLKEAAQEAAQDVERYRQSLEALRAKPPQAVADVLAWHRKVRELEETLPLMETIREQKQAAHDDTLHQARVALLTAWGRRVRDVQGEISDLATAYKEAIRYAEASRYEPERIAQIHAEHKERLVEPYQRLYHLRTFKDQLASYEGD